MNFLIKVFNIIILIYIVQDRFEDDITFVVGLHLACNLDIVAVFFRSASLE